MFYQFELVLAGIILLTAMALGGFSLWRKRRNALQQKEQTENDEQNL